MTSDNSQMYRKLIEKLYQQMAAELHAYDKVIIHDDNVIMVSFYAGPRHQDRVLMLQIEHNIAKVAGSSTLPTSNWMDYALAYRRAIDLVGKYSFGY